jgi:hypothetical protein
MAREIFLVDYGDNLPEDKRKLSINRHATFLKKLGVGHEEFEPFIFHPNVDEYRRDAAEFAGHLGTNKLVQADFIAPHWQPPFDNPNLIKTNLICIAAYALQREKMSLPVGQSAQMVVVAQSELANEFIRHYPGGLASDYYNADRKAPVYNHYYIEHIAIPQSI